MKKSNIYRLIPLLFIALVLGCNENEWDDYYHNNELVKQSDLRLADYIESIDELSIFSQMLEITGYDSVLNASQTYTVWAPKNSALEGVDLNNTELVHTLVSNHIARFSYPTSGIDTKLVFMLNGKNLRFERVGESSFTFGSNTVSNANIGVDNGIVHIIDDYVPYLNNIWELILSTEGLDSLADYLNSRSQLVFVPGLSTEIGIDEDGRVIYDSVFVFTNDFFRNLGSVNIEDSSYTVLLPDNQAWSSAYNTAKDYFVTLDEFGGAATQKENAQWAILQDIVYRDFIEDPLSLTDPVNDSIVSTSGNVFYGPAYLFQDAQSYRVSNGIAYVTDTLYIPPTKSYHKAIKVEAENEEFFREPTNAKLFLRTGQGSDVPVSGGRYIIVVPTTTSSISRVRVNFPIPNTLSAKYNIYCVFVPAYISGSTNNKPTRVKFYLSFLDERGRYRTNRSVTSDEVWVTNPDTITKMFVTQYDYNYSNLIDLDEGYVKEDIRASVMVESDVSINETTEFTREMRIDYIILEPVEE